MGCASSTSPDILGVSKEMQEIFEAMPADKKLKSLWEKCTEDTGARGWRGSFLKIVEMMVDDDLQRVAKHPGDQMPACPVRKGHEATLQRERLLHIQGSVACFEWKPVGDACKKYSGVYSKGSKNIIGRFSYGNGPWFDQIENVPGFALKFLRSGAPSSHIIAMNNLLGVELNYFGSDLSSHMGEVNMDSCEIPLGVKALVAKFRSTFPDALSRMKIGSSGFASFDPETGKALDAKDVNFPFRLQFHPPKDVRDVFHQSEVVQAALKEKDDMILSKHLQQYPEGTVLYHIYAQEKPTSDPEGPPPALEHIGDLIMATKFTTSKFGDRSLFFRHEFIIEDTKFKPELKDQVAALEALEGKMSTQWRPTAVSGN
jgi:hypothetical protein